MKPKPFLPEDFLLTTKWARMLYFEHASGQPIFDYHCHLPPDEIANNRRFENLYQIWLGGDHYKWRAMRSNGVPENLITLKNTSDYDKFMAYARTVPHTLRNPLYHWSHLELRRYFGINEIINRTDCAQDLGESQPQADHPGAFDPWHPDQIQGRRRLHD